MLLMFFPKINHFFLYLSQFSTDRDLIFSFFTLNPIYWPPGHYPHNPLHIFTEKVGSSWVYLQYDAWCLCKVNCFLCYWDQTSYLNMKKIVHLQPTALWMATIPMFRTHMKTKQYMSGKSRSSPCIFFGCWFRIWDPKGPG